MTFTGPSEPMKDDEGRWVLASPAPRGLTKPAFVRWANEVVTGWGNQSLSDAEKDLVWLAYQQGDIENAGGLLFDIVGQARPADKDAQRLGTGMKRGSLEDTEQARYSILSPDMTRGGRAGQAQPPPAPSARKPPTPEQAQGYDTEGKRQKPDMESVVTALGGPQSEMGQFMQNYLATHPAASDTFSLWGEGVDENAPVTGFDRTGPPIGAFGAGPGSKLQWPGKTQTVGQWLTDLYKMKGPDVRDLQQELWDQGWYEGTKVTDASMIQWGRPDAATVAAYSTALGEAARYKAAGRHLNIDDVIEMGSPLKGIGKEAKGTPFERTTRSEANAALRSEAQNVLGRDPTEAEMAAFASQYRSEEDMARRAYIDAAANNRTVGIEGPGELGAAAADYLDVHNLADKVAYGAAVRQQAFYQMLKSPT